jgi:hypothetical protein
MSDTTTTRVYGSSDDLIEFDGEFTGEVCRYGTDAQEHGVLVVMSDGSMLNVKYGKPGLGGAWGVTLVKPGALFDRIDQCTDEEADPYSDVAYFRTGIKWAFAANEWERVS